MKQNQNGVYESMRRLEFCNWFSRVHQERYWTGSPWRAFSEMMR